MPVRMRWRPSPTATKSRSSPGAQADMGPATAFVPRRMALKAGSGSATCGAHGLPSRRQPPRPLRRLRVPRCRARSNPKLPGVGSASARTEEGGISAMGGRVPAVLGRSGMELFVEPSVRALIADQLGVGVEELVPGVSLRDDLAADSLDLVELTMALEAEFGIVVPERILDQVRTYGDLVQATGLLIRARRAAEGRAAEPPLRMWTRVVPPAGKSGGSLERAGRLTPYTAETIAEDAVRAGHGAQREVPVAASADDIELARVQHHFAWLGEHDVWVTVRRKDRAVAPSASPIACS